MHDAPSMDNVLDLVRYRRMRYEMGRTERELAAVDFDRFGNPRPLADARVREAEQLEARVTQALRAYRDHSGAKP